MDIRKLRIFQEAARQENFTKAATNLYMSQPAVSKAIQELEQEANTLLFERFSKRTILTPAGKKLFVKAEALLQMNDEVQNEIYSLEKNSTLRIGSSITIANEMLCCLIKQLTCLFPKVHIEVEIAIVPTILQKLNNNEIDIAFIEGVLAQNDIISIPFSAYTIHPVCSSKYYQNHPIHNLNDLVKQPLLLREKGSALRDVIDSILLLNDITVKPIWTSTNSNALLQAALNDFGIAFLPANMIQKKIHEKALVEIKIDGFHLKNMNHLVYKEKKHVNKVMQKLIQLANEYALK